MEAITAVTMAVDTAMPVTLEDGVAALELAEAATQSLGTGEIVTL